MARFTKERLDSFDDYDDIVAKRLSPKERRAIEAEAEQELAALHAMQESVSLALAEFMANESIGINELTRRLQTSSRQTSRLMKGEANATLATIAAIASLIGKQAKLVFEDVAPKKDRKTGSKSSRARA